MGRAAVVAGSRLARFLRNPARVHLAYETESSRTRQSGNQVMNMKRTAIRTLNQAGQLAGNGPRIDKIKNCHLFAFALLVLTVGCNSMGSRHPVPETMLSRAEISGMPGVRVLVSANHV